jgi:hypothetical protein
MLELTSVRTYSNLSQASFNFEVSGRVFSNFASLDAAPLNSNNTRNLKLNFTSKFIGQVERIDKEIKLFIIAHVTLVSEKGLRLPTLWAAVLRGLLTSQVSTSSNIIQTQANFFRDQPRSNCPSLSPVMQ